VVHAVISGFFLGWHLPASWLIFDRSRQPDATDDVHFVWVGRWDDSSKPWANHDVRQLGLTGRIHFVGETKQPARYFAAADTFVMPSREESCGMVALKAAASGRPVVSFQGAVGAAEMLSARWTFEPPQASHRAGRHQTPRRVRQPSSPAWSATRTMVRPRPRKLPRLFNDFSEGANAASRASGRGGAFEMPWPGMRH